jgi:multimeric flavodoxin WrbA
MRILGISGSPRAKGNTDILVQEALKAASEMGAEQEFIAISGKKIKPCNGCGTCRTDKSKGICTIKDDDVPGIYEAMKRADGIIVASPVYFLSITAQLKALFDRSVILRYAKGTPQDRPGVPGGPEFLLKNKVGGAIAVGGGRDGGQLFTINSILQWMLMHNMIVVGNNYGMGGSAKAGMKGDATNDEIGLAMARHVGLHVAEVAGKIQNKERT